MKITVQTEDCQQARGHAVTSAGTGVIGVTVRPLTLEV